MDEAAATRLDPTTLRALPRAGSDPDRCAVVCDSGESLTYGQLANRASRLAGALRQRGLAVGDVVAVLCENSPAYFGCPTTTSGRSRSR